MKIISFNINGIRAIQKKGLKEFISTQNPDVICFQEVKARATDIQFEEFDEYPYWVWATAEKLGYSGVATFSKEDFLDSKSEIGMPRFDSEGRFNILEFEHFILFNIYFPNGGASEERHFFKMDFLEDFLLYLKNHTGKPLVLTGDFNIAHKDIDIHDPIGLNGESGFKPEERAWLDKLEALGFIDCFRYKHGEKTEVYSWWSYRQGSRVRNKGWRIDYFWASKELKSRIKDCYYMCDLEGSDHCPVVLELDF